MKKAIALFILGLAIASTSAGAAEGVKSPAAPKSSANGLDPAKGRFHQIHTRKLKLGCSTCHSRDTKDPLFLRKDDVVPASMPGQVDRSVCLGCHQEPNKPAWYGASSK